jgi:hypothetical protein
MNPKHFNWNNFHFPLSLPHLSCDWASTFKISLLTFSLKERRLVEQSTYFSYAALIRAKSPFQLIILSLNFSSRRLLCLSNIHFSFISLYGLVCWIVCMRRRTHWNKCTTYWVSKINCSKIETRNEIWDFVDFISAWSFVLLVWLALWRVKEPLTKWAYVENGLLVIAHGHKFLRGWFTTLVAAALKFHCNIESF